MRNKYIVYTDSFIFTCIADNVKDSISLVEGKYGIRGWKPKRVEICGYGLFQERKCRDAILPCLIDCNLDNCVEENNSIYLIDGDNNKILIGIKIENNYQSVIFKKDPFMKLWKTLCIQNNPSLKEDEIFFKEKLGEVMLICSKLEELCDFVSGFLKFRVDLGILNKY
jgi:hypothetical protein